MSLHLLTRYQLERLARDLDRENDDLRRDNERLLKALAQAHPMRSDDAPATERQQETKLSEMCCGGTCVRAVCFIHGPQGAKP